MSTAETPDLTLWTSKMTSAACSACGALYAGLGLEPSPIIELLLTAGPLVTVVLWLQKDAARRQTGALLDWGWFIYAAWIIAIPVYAFQTRGRHGWRLALGLLTLILAPYIVSATVAWLVYGLSNQAAS